MSKAYDRVEWVFLEAIMLKLGFAPDWMNLGMRCISSVSYSFNINGNRVGCVTPSWGLRQRDPLSPYLFLLCAQGLSSLLIKAKSRRYLSGLSLSRSGLPLSHLFFAGDSLLFFKASKMESS